MEMKNKNKEIERLRERVELLEDENKRFKELAYKDPLTKVYNRAWFKENINRYAKVYLVFVDLNNLKVVNDAHGHEEGDKYILKTVEIIEKYGDVVRYGGDEFLVISSDKSNYEKLLKLQSTYFSVGGVEPKEYSTIAEAIKIADERLYVNKQKNKIRR